MKKQESKVKGVIIPEVKKVTVPFDSEKKTRETETALVIRETGKVSSIAWISKAIDNVTDRLTGQLNVNRPVSEWPKTGSILIESANGNKRELKLSAKKVEVSFSNMPNNPKGSMVSVSIDRKAFDKAIEKLSDISVDDINTFAKDTGKAFDFGE